jgi:hypothetical protein
MCRKFWVMTWRTLLGGALGSESIELLGWREVPFDPLCQLALPQHIHKFNTGESILRGV